jgi:hypothetical protein
MKKVEAYLTVEAAMVLPIVLGTILFVIYLLFFQYDRCLMEQGAGVLAMRGCTLQTADSKELVEVLLIQSQQEDERYLAWNACTAQIRMKGNYVKVEYSGVLDFPFKGLAFWRDSSAWDSKATYENLRIKPTFFVRKCRKIMGGK